MDVGSVFVSNYPPYSFWRHESVGEAHAALDAPAAPGAELGLYVHIPFCRERCKFCYFKVYTDKDSGQVRRYLAALAAEARSYAERPSVQGRRLTFVYFGGGTPSFISSPDIRRLAQDLKAAIPWEGAEEVAFECEPGTITPAKLEVLKEVGVTRLSLGVESFDDEVLKMNGRAHLRNEIDRSLEWIRAAGFDQVNIDLIAGMVGEAEETWRASVRLAIEADPDSVTIYQLELPHNTVFAQSNLPRLATWEEKRAWHSWAIDAFQEAGYEISTAYTMVRRGAGVRFVYRDSVWRGCDMIGLGVASFGHMNGVHMQNAPEWGAYLEALEAGRLPLDRAYRTSAGERLTREMILQLKEGRLRARPFRDKFGTEILSAYAGPFERLRAEGMMEIREDGVDLTREGLLRVDGLLPEFYAPQHRNARYT